MGRRRCPAFHDDQRFPARGAKLTQHGQQTDVLYNFVHVVA